MMSGAEDVPRGQRILDGMSGVPPEGFGGLTESETAWLEIGNWPNTVMRPQVM
jgi:hypothetical protein